MERWSAPIDIYCERMGPEFWAEPMNAVSNLAFVLAAIWAAVTARRLKVQGLDILALIGLAGLIGIGSFLFHTFATGWSALADVIPIWIFVVLCVLSGIHRVGGVAPRKIFIGFSVVCAASLLAALLWPEHPAEASHSHDPAPLNGSLQYAPAWIAMLCFAVVTGVKRHPVAGWVIGATIVFTISLVFRTIDMSLCEALPHGTHFVWHLLNGVMIAFLLQALLRASNPNKV